MAKAFHFHLYKPLFDLWPLAYLLPANSKALHGCKPVIQCVGMLELSQSTVTWKERKSYIKLG